MSGKKKPNRNTKESMTPEQWDRYKEMSRLRMKEYYARKNAEKLEEKRISKILYQLYLEGKITLPADK